MSDKPLDNSPENQLERMRAGYNLPLELVFNELKVPCRLVPAKDMATVISNAKAKLNVPAGHDRETLEGHATMRAVLECATTVGNTTHLGDRFLDLVTHDELVALHDQYESKCKFVNTAFSEMSNSEISEIIVTIKKKAASTSAYSMWQLAEVGRYFLDRLPAMDKNAGGA